MIRYLKKNDGLLLLLAPTILVVVSVALAIAGIYFKPTYEGSSIVTLLFGFDAVESMVWVNVALTVPLAMFVIVLLNRSVQQFGFIGRLSNLPLVVGVVLFFLIPESINGPLLWIYALMFIFYINQCARILEEKKVRVSVFNSAFVIGIMQMIFPIALPIYFSLIMVLLLTRTITLKLTVLSVIGFLLPVYLVGCLVYLLTPDQIVLFVKNSATFYAFDIVEGDYVSIGLLILVFITALISNLSTGVSTLREQRKWRFELILLVSSMLALFFGKPMYAMFTVIVPAIIIFSRAMVLTRSKWFGGAIFYLLLMMAVINLGNLI